MKRLFLSVIMVLGLSTKSTLSQSQYKKYLQLINAELKNRGLSTYILNISEI